MSHDEILCDDVAHLHFGVILAVADGALVLFFPLEFEDQDLFASSVRGNGPGDGPVGDLVTSQQLARVSENGQDFGERDLGTDITVQLGHTNHIARGNPVLFSAGFYNGMHWENPRLGSPNTPTMLGLVV